nr:uncharacterized mitochondrial protein AtMg00810-like [Tanacetum cinerariifolium]
MTKPRHAKPIVTKTNSPTRRHITYSPSLKTSNSPSRVTAVKAPLVNAAQGMQGRWEWKPKCPILDHVSRNTSESMTLKRFDYNDALGRSKVIDSRCSRHMTRNMSFLSDFEELNGGYVTFRGKPKGGKISRKGKIRTGKLYFDDVYFVKELKFNLFSVSQMCDKKNSVLFTDTGCLVLSPAFKLPDESQVLLRVPRENNMYNNMVLVTKPHNKTPYELLHGRTPSIDFMRPFGCPVTILNTLDSLGKFDRKVDEGFLVGYYVSSKAFRVFNSRTRIVQKTLHVIFLENKPNVVGSGPTWLFDIDSVTKTVNYQPVTTGNQSNPSAGFQDKFDAEKAGEESEQQYVLFPMWSSGSTNPQNTNGDDVFDEKKPEDLSEEFEDFSNNGINEVNAAGNLAPTVGQIYPNSTNTFSTVGPSNVAASPTHGKSSCIDASQLPDDLDMQELEDTTYSDDVGAEADFNNLETSITEELLQFKMQKVLVLVDLSHGKRDIGTKWVFKNKKDERDIVVRNKARLVVQGHTREKGIDYEEVFAPVARIEAIRLFLAYASFISFMVYQMDVKSAFLYGTIEEEVYVCQPLGFEDPDHPNKRKKDEIFISHDKYVVEILRKFRLTDGKSASTPIDTEKPLLKDPDGKDVDVYTYRSMIGSLMYLTSSRPDIMFAVCACARFQMTPKGSHLHAFKRIFRYLKGKPHLGLWYPKDSPFDLVAYSESDYAGVSLDRKSITGGCQFLGCRLISWQCKKQTVVATSFTEAEYVAAVSCCAQVLWIQNQLLDYGLTMHVVLSGQTATGKEISNPFMAEAYCYMFIDDKVFAVKSKFSVCMSAKRTSWNEFSSSMASAEMKMISLILKPILEKLNQDPSTEFDIEIIDPILERFIDEPALIYSPPSRDDDDDDDDLFDLKSDNNEWKKLFYGDFYKDIDFEKHKNKDSKMKLLVIEAHIIESNVLLTQLLTSDLTLPGESSESFEIASLSLSPFENEDKVFNPCILILGGTQIFNDESKDKDYKVNISSEGILILEERNFLPISSDQEHLFHLELTVTETLLSFSSKNKDKVFNPGILNLKGVHSLTLELSHRTYETFKIINIHLNIFNEGPMKIFPFFCFCPKDKGIQGRFRLVARIAPDYEDSCAYGFVHRSLELQSLACIYIGI